jgi:sigma-B regulation protein RsbU (phosphoserine phosphatase)
VSGRPLLRLSVAAEPASLKPLRDALCAQLDRLGVERALRDRLKLVLDEAAANVIRHAYRDCSPGRIELTVERRRGLLRIRLRDEAPPVDPGCVRPRDLDECRPGGLGVNFIDATMDGWRLRPLPRGRGNVLTMFKRLNAAGDDA